MRRWMLSALAAGIAAAIAGWAPLALAETLQQYQTQERQVTEQLDAAQQSYQQALRAWSAAQTRLIALDHQLSAGAAHLKTLTAQTAAARQSLRIRQGQVSQAKGVVAADQGQAGQGLVLIDEHGSVSFLSVLLGAHTFADFLTRLDGLQKVWGEEMQWLRQARADQARLQTLEDQQQQTVNNLATLQGEAAQQVTALNVEQGQAAAANRAEAAATAAADQAVRGLLQQKNGLQAKIQEIITELESANLPWSQVLKDINALAAQYGIDPLLVEAVVLQESGGQSRAKSSVGAMGLMQLMPGTAAGLGVTNAYDPIQNLRGGITYLLDMLHKFGGNLKLALAAYNAGPYAVQKYGGIPPYQQTQTYVHNVLSLYNSGK